MLKEILDAYVDETQKVFKHDRMKSIGASEIGYCARRIWYVKAAEERDKDYLDRWGATRRGDLIEEHLVVPALRKRFGNRLLWAGKSQRNFREGNLSATPDGIITRLKYDALRHLGIKDIKSDCIMIEIKSIDPRANLDKERHQHRMQTITQLGLVRLKTEYKPYYALIVYIDASFHDDISEFVIEWDPKVFTTIQQRADKIITAKNAADLLPEGYIAGGSECEHCPFKDPCGIARHMLPSNKFKDQEIDPQRIAEMTDLCREAQELEQVRDQYSADLKTQQETIRNRLREWNLTKIPGVVTLSSVKGRLTYDNESLREAAAKAGIDVEKFSRVGDPTSRLTISLPQERA